MSIYKDEFFESILDKLNGALDTDLFEKCVVDVLRKNDYPTLVPISGGQDSGMDGAVSDGRGTPIPLVTTTNKSPITNLNKNLSKYVADGGSRREAILATSVSLTPRRIKKLYEKAKDLGFSLIQVYEQEALAMRLYHEPSWCKNLLGLTGRPRALSKIPINSRSVLSSENIGREFEKQEIVEKLSRSNDILILGQPGIGKTFLLTELVKEKDAYFVNSNDRERIYGDIRELKPEYLIIDDAQIKTEILKELIHFRNENDVNFGLICVTWPSHKEELLTELEVTEADCVELRLLSRSDIVKVINSCGISRPNNLIWHLVNQATGRPGLAAMLTKICLSGGVNDFITGKALRRVLLSSLKKHFGAEVEQVLAYFSCAGDLGSTFKDVSDWSKIDKLKLHRIISDMALLGILKEVQNNRLAVIPEDLRFILVRDNFFAGPISLDSQILFNLAETEGAVVEVLIGVLGKGGRIDESDLYRLIKKHGTKSILNMYAGLGRVEVLKLINDFPDNIESFLHYSLAYAPEEAVPILLKQAIEDPKENLNSLPGHPARRLQDWSSSARSGSNNVILNKQILVKSIVNYLGDSEADDMLYVLLPNIFSPLWSDSESDPGNGMTFTLTNGIYSATEVKEMTGLWDLLFKKLSHLNHIKWDSLLKVLSNFACPHAPRVSIPEEIRKECRNFAIKIINDLYEIGNRHLGVCLKLKSYSDIIKYKKKIEIDHDFTVLFPKDSLRADYKLVEKNNLRNTELLVEGHVDQDPSVILARLEEINRYAKEAGQTWPDQTIQYSYLLASKVKDPVLWFYKSIELKISPKFFEPFIPRAISNLDEQMEKKIIELLDTEYFWILCANILLINGALEVLINESLKRLGKQYAQAIEHLFYRKISTANAKRLLCHKCPEIREAAAIGEYLAGDERGIIREELRDDWEKAIISAKDEEHWLKEILQKHPNLAFEWVKKRLNEDQFLSYYERETFDSAMNVLDESHSVELVKLLNTELGSEDKITKLVGDSEDCFKALLENNKLKELHLAPLERKVGNVLVSFILLTLGYGYTTEELARAIYSYGDGWYGKESEMLSGRIGEYQNTLKTVVDQNVRNVISLVISFFEDRKKRALMDEHEKDVFGRF